MCKNNEDKNPKGSGIKQDNGWGKERKIIGESSRGKGSWNSGSHRKGSNDDKPMIHVEPDSPWPRK